MYGYAVCLFYGAGEQLHTNIHAIQKAAEALKMLLCQNLCRSHDTGLEPIVDGNKH